MYISMNWIRDFVDLSGLDINKLIQQFSAAVDYFRQSGQQHDAGNGNQQDAAFFHLKRSPLENFTVIIYNYIGSGISCKGGSL